MNLLNLDRPLHPKEHCLPIKPACEEATAADSQRLTNYFATVALMSYLNTLLLEGALLHHRSFFDARSGYMRSDPAVGTGAGFKRWWRSC